MPSGEILLYVKGADSSILPHVLEPGAPEIPETQETSGNQSAFVMIVSHRFTSFHMVSHRFYIIM
jgi:hypothetical protein